MDFQYQSNNLVSPMKIYKYIYLKVAFLQSFGFSCKNDWFCRKPEAPLQEKG